MAKSKPAAVPPNTSAPPKLPRLPKGTKITKRPLLHPPIAAPRASRLHHKVIYLSATTPFISAVKRVRKYLSAIDARASGPLSLLAAPAPLPDRQRLQSLGKGAQQRSGEEVAVKATGKAVEKALRLGLYFQAQGDVLVRLRTGSVGAVDDVLVPEREGNEAAAAATAMDEDEDDGDDVPETRVRRTSMLEVGISLR